MRSVLTRVNVYILGGSKLDLPLLEASIDSAHMHGSMIGRHPVTRVPAWTPTPFDFSKETDEMKAKAHTKSCYNKVRSNSIPLDRPVPDVRPAECKNQWYYAVRPRDEQRGGLVAGGLDAMGGGLDAVDAMSLPATSVVFVFYNEPLSPLLRAIYSVLDRTPPQLLHEIILVDDGSDEEAPWLADGGEFELHLQLLPKTKLARLSGRNGLMRARNVGASLATGETITFLDSHIEVGPGWLEPLSGRIAEGIRDGMNRVVVPAIDNIDADNFVYNAGGIDVLGHTWGLGQTGITTEFDGNSVKPMRSPIMAGGLLSLSRKYFDELGFYDPEMRLWGGEEMEISFRIWLCGGTLECVPCSRVGHVFRSSKYWKGQVYKVPGEEIARNKRRASFWMDEYGQLARLSSAPLKDGETLGPMEHYTDIKKRLKCKPYRWYLENVYPQMLESADKLLGGADGRDVEHMFVGSGYLKNSETETCLDHLHYKADGAVYGVYPCHYQRGSQSALYTNGKLVLAGDNLLDACLTRDEDGKLKRRKCVDELEQRQIWEMEQLSEGHVLMKGGNKCLTVVAESEVEEKSPFTLRMMDCKKEGTERRFQMWYWESLRDGALGENREKIS